MDETEFQRRLAELIQCYDAAHDEDGPEAERWDEEWEEFMIELSVPQYERAIELLSLHVTNLHSLNDDSSH